MSSWSQKNTEKLKKRMKDDKKYGSIFCLSFSKAYKSPINSKYQLLAMLLDPRFKDVLVKNESLRSRKELFELLKYISIITTSRSSHEADIETTLDGSGLLCGTFSTRPLNDKKTKDPLIIKPT